MLAYTRAPRLLGLPCCGMFGSADPAETGIDKRKDVGVVIGMLLSAALLGGLIVFASGEEKGHLRHAKRRR